MKTLIKSSALLFVFALFSTGVFAASTAAADSTAQDAIAISALGEGCAINVSIDKATVGNTLVVIYDDTDNVIFRESLSKAEGTINKLYNFDGLEDGYYDIEVTSNDVTVEKTINVYSDENDQKLEIAE